MIRKFAHDVSELCWALSYALPALVGTTLLLAAVTGR